MFTIWSYERTFSYSLASQVDSDGGKVKYAYFSI